MPPALARPRAVALLEPRASAGRRAPACSRIVAAATSLAAALLAALLVHGCKPAQRPAATPEGAPPAVTTPAIGSAPTSPQPGPGVIASPGPSAPGAGKSAGYAVADVANPASLEVVATFVGDAIPEPEEVDVNIDVPVCGHKVFHEEVLVDKATRGLRNVVVRLEGIHQGKAAPALVTVANQECRFEPHVSVAMTGMKLQIRNDDPVLHTTHPYINGANFFNLALTPREPPPPPRPIPRPGLMEVKCDVHKWMKGYVLIHTNPYAGVTDTSGKLRIEGIPPGKYSFVAWHEELGEKRGELELAPDGVASLQLEFPPKS